MFFLPCINCKSLNVESTELDTIDAGARRSNHVLHQQAVSGHRHPLIAAGVTAVSIGRFIWKRFPGGGEKRCKDCGHVYR